MSRLDEIRARLAGYREFLTSDERLPHDHPDNQKQLDAWAAFESNSEDDIAWLLAVIDAQEKALEAADRAAQTSNNVETRDAYLAARAKAKEAAK